MRALLVGRFHAVTLGQARWLESLRDAPVDRLVCVVTSANLDGTRRNPFDLRTRLAMLEPALRASGKPYDVVPIDDVPDSAAWVAHVQGQVQRALGRAPGPADTHVYSANHEVRALFEAQGFTVTAEQVEGLTPHELLRRVAEQKDWAPLASEASRAVLGRPEVLTRLRAIFGQQLLTDDGELGHQRDFDSYGAQMDASLKQKLEDFLPWVKPGCIVDKGCGTGQLLVELSRLFPASALVGVDLSREFLRRCDENTYATEDVSLLFGDITAQSVPDGSASTVVFSSVTHEIYSYNGYSLEALDRAFQSAFRELDVGGRVLIRDGVSPGHGVRRLRFATAAVNDVFERFAKEFKHGAGARFARLGPLEVELDAHDANEFICKKDYLKNWHIEVHEEFGAHTLDGYVHALERSGFRPVVAKGYVNPWIREHRYEGQVVLTDEHGAVVPWPATNALLVAEKPAQPS
ncbi:MAG: methyltransferase domain-containing protein [Myxococcaceae bacterium]|nr:methyltransferase domain-containing protein [Myxococcaceae bacterium]